jgi:hypothetical protein
MHGIHDVLHDDPSQPSNTTISVHWRGSPSSALPVGPLDSTKHLVRDTRRSGEPWGHRCGTRRPRAMRACVESGANSAESARGHGSAPPPGGCWTERFHRDCECSEVSAEARTIRWGCSAQNQPRPDRSRVGGAGARHIDVPQSHG